MGGAAFYPDLLDKIRLAGCYQEYFVSGVRSILPGLKKGLEKKVSLQWINATIFL